MGLCGISIDIDLIVDFALEGGCYYCSKSYSSFDLFIGALLSGMGTQQMVAATQEKCNQMVQLYEPSSEAKSNNQLLLDGNETV